MISNTTVNFSIEIINLMISFRSSEFFCDSSDFCKKACGSTARGKPRAATHRTFMPVWFTRLVCKYQLWRAKNYLATVREERRKSTWHTNRWTNNTGNEQLQLQISIWIQTTSNTMLKQVDRWITGQISKPNTFALSISDRKCQKSVTRPFLSQSPYLVGSRPRGPPFSPVSGFTSLGNAEIQATHRTRNIYFEIHNCTTDWQDLNGFTLTKVSLTQQTVIAIESYECCPHLQCIYLWHANTRSITFKLQCVHTRNIVVWLLQFQPFIQRMLTAS